MKIHLKITLIFLLILVFILTGLYIFTKISIIKFNKLVNRSYSEKNIHISKVLKLKNLSAETLAYDYSYWDELVNFLKTGDKNWAKSYIDTAIPTYKVDFIFVYNADFNLVYSFSGIKETSFIEPLLHQDSFKNALQKKYFLHFYSIQNSVVIEINTAPIQPTADTNRTTKPYGFFITGQAWTKKYLEEISSITNSRTIVFRTPLRGIPPSELEKKGIFVAQLNGFDGKAIAFLQMTNKVEYFAELRNYLNLQWLIITFIVFFVVFIFYYATYIWISRPLLLISKTLEKENPAILKKLKYSSIEFIQLSELINNFFKQRINLINEYIKIKYLCQEKEKILQKHIESETLTAQKLSDEIGELNELMSLYKISGNMSSSLGLSALLELIIKSACETLNADSGSILIIDNEKNELNMEAKHNLNIENPSKIKIPLGEKVGGWVAKHSEPLLLVSGINKYPQFLNLKPRSEIKCSMVVPIKYKDEILGTINLNSKTSEGAFTARDLKLLAIFATNIALAINDTKVYEKLKEIDKLKTEFVSNVSHELKTPLMSIMGSIDYIISSSREKLSKEEMEMLEICIRNTLRMDNLIKDLLDFSRIESNTFVINREKVSLKLIINEIIEEIKNIAEKKKLAIEAAFPCNLNEIELDPLRIKQVLVNLIGNSIKFTPENGKIAITVDCNLDQHKIEISVTDTGIGIKPEYHKKIFDKFYQIDGSTTRSAGGTGLGLAISKKIIELHKGSIWVESPPMGRENGSKFIFTLPV